MIVYPFMEENDSAVFLQPYGRAVGLPRIEEVLGTDAITTFTIPGTSYKMYTRTKQKPNAMEENLVASVVYDDDRTVYGPACIVAEVDEQLYWLDKEQVQEVFEWIDRFEF